MTCEHLRFESDLNVGRIALEEGGPIAGYVVDCSIRCGDCHQEFEVCWTDPATPNVIPLSLSLQNKRPWVSGMGTIMGWCIRPVEPPEPWQHPNVNYMGSA